MGLTLEIRYHDHWIRILMTLFGGHFMVAIHEPESTLDLISLPGYFPALLGSCFIAFLLINSIYFATAKLDQSLGWTDQKNRRISAQLILGFFLPCILSYLLAWLYFMVRGLKIYNTSFSATDFPIIVVFIAFVNCYYVAHYFVRFSHQLIKSKSNKTEIVMAKSVREKIETPVHSNEQTIAYYYHHNRYNFAYSFNGNLEVIYKTMDEIYQNISPKTYFKIQKAFIIHRNIIDSYQSASSRRILVNLKTPFLSRNIEGKSKMTQEEVRTVLVSQRHAKAFKQWLKA